MWNIFKNDNEWNEKTVVGFIAFLIMCAIMVADLVTGLVGKDLIDLISSHKISQFFLPKILETKLVL